MRIVSLILITVIVYLGREITTLKSHISTNLDQTIQTPLNDVVSTPRPRLLLWSSEISPNGEYRAASYTGDYADRYHYYQVFITNVTNDRMQRIYTGDFRTLGWEWTNDNRIKIFYNCGTGCRASKIMGMNEHIAIADYENGGMNERNGWNVEFLKSF